MIDWHISSVLVGIMVPTAMITIASPQSSNRSGFAAKPLHDGPAAARANTEPSIDTAGRQHSYPSECADFGRACYHRPEAPTRRRQFDRYISVTPKIH
jgi:hypothetical protein